MMPIKTMALKFSNTNILDRYRLSASRIEISSGQCFVLLGQNGVGKTSLIQFLIKAIRDRLQSTIEISPQNLRIDLGFMPENESISYSFTAKEHLFYQLKLHGKSEIKQRISQAAREFDLIDLLDTPFRHLSKGQKRKFLFSHAVVHDPQILILDEPCSGLDPIMQSKMESWVLKQKRAERIIIAIVHNLKFAHSIADQIGVLRNHTIEMFDGSKMTFEDFHIRIKSLLEESLSDDHTIN